MSIERGGGGAGGRQPPVKREELVSVFVRMQSETVFFLSWPQYAVRPL